MAASLCAPSVTGMTDLERFRHEVHTSSGRASYLDTAGDDPPVLFVHGIGTSSLLWRHVITPLVGERRCVAVDLPLHGHTPVAPGQEFSLAAFATFVADVCDALGLDDVDLVANDTGGAVAQIVAARRPARLRSLVLTNCESEGNVPPWAFLPAVWLARAGLLAPLLARRPADPRRPYRIGYTDVTALPEDLARAWQEPLISRPREYQRWVASLHDRDLRAVGPALRRLEVPTLAVWGTGDLFFTRRRARWLRDTIPGATEIVEVPGGRLFFPDERAGELLAALRRHWQHIHH